MKKQIVEIRDSLKQYLECEKEFGITEFFSEKKQVKIIKESPKLKEEEDGTAMKIEEEIEEGTPQDIIDEDIKKEKDNKDKGASK